MANNVVWAKPVLLVEAGRTGEVITFCKAAFGAAEVETMDGSSEINICGLSIVIQDSAAQGQGPAGGNSQILVLLTEDVGAAVAKAVSAGAVELELDEWDAAKFNGGLMGKVRDPYGFVWHIRHRSCTN